MPKEKSYIEHVGIMSEGYGLAPMVVLMDGRLSDPAKLVYMVLGNFSRGKESAFPSQKKIAEILGKKNVSTISERIAELESAGYIRKSREGKYGRMVYYMLNEINEEKKKDLFGDEATPVAAPNRGRKSKNPPELIEAMKRVRESYFAKFKEVVGHDCTFPFAAGTKIITDTIKQRGEESAKKLISDLFFRNKWAKVKGYSIMAFPTVCNELLSGLKGESDAGGLGFKQISGRA